MAVDKNAERERIKSEIFAAKTASKEFRGDLRNEVKRLYNSRSGALHRISAAPSIRKGELRGVRIIAPEHAYVHHYGFAGNRLLKGKKLFSVFTRIKGTLFIEDAIRKGSIDKLADKISEIRADELVANITFR